jgi:hypothetical protein
MLLEPADDFARAGFRSMRYPGRVTRSRCLALVMHDKELLTGATEKVAKGLEEMSKVLHVLTNA